MRKAFGVLLLPLLLCLILPARALTGEEVQARQEELLELDKLERAASDSGGTARYGAGLDEGLAGLMETGTKELRSVVQRALRSGVLLMVILLFCALSETVREGAGPSLGVSLAGTLAVSVVAVADVNSLLGMGTGAIGNMASFANVLLPTVAAVTAATGAITGAAARQMAAVLFSDLLVNLINSLLVPLLYGYIAACIVSSALGTGELDRIAALFKWTVTTALTVVVSVFVGYLTISGVVSGATDAMTVKAARFAISGGIPVVGGILSDASETVLASAGVLKGTVGVFGMVSILGICLLPLLRLAIHYLTYKLVAALAAALGKNPVCGLVERLGGAFGLVLGMTGSCCLLLLIALVSSISVAAA